MKLTQLFTLILFLSPAWSNATTLVAGTVILENVVWDVDTVLINQDMRIAVGRCVRVKDGTQILLAKNVSITLAGGAFKCLGGRLGIVMDCQEEDHYWNGFVILSSTTVAELEFKRTQIHHAYTFFLDNMRPAVLSMDSSEVTNSGGLSIMARNTKLSVTNCHFNGGSGGIAMGGEPSTFECTVS